MAISKLITISETAQILRISVKTLYRWVYERRLPHYKIGSKVCFLEKDIETYIGNTRIDCYEFAKQ